MAGILTGRRRKVTADLSTSVSASELQSLRPAQSNNLPTSPNDDLSVISNHVNDIINNASNNHVNRNTSTQSLSSANKFNPRLIFSQIVAIQSLHYLALSFLFQVNHVLFGTDITIDRIFTGNYLNVWTAEGWIDNGAFLTTSIFGAFLLAFIVEKSKKCLDFSVTSFTIHLLICSFYEGKFPRSWDWWIMHVLGMIVMILLGEYLCSRLEMREIPLLLL